MICFAWWGFPQYAARCVGVFVNSVHERVVVVATRPKVPIEGMELLCGCDVVWVAQDDVRSVADICGEMPRVLISSGWCVPAFNRYAAEVRRNRGKVIATVDNNYFVGFIEFIKKIRFQLFQRKKFDGFIVPGNAGRRLLRYYGVNEDIVASGVYSADQSLFSNGAPLPEREKKIIYVGQFINRKNVRRMVKAFAAANKAIGEEWTLELYGSGPLREELLRSAGKAIVVHDFVQPEELAGLYKKARAFCLLSLEEHWGVVVHEAALSGCALLLSNRVGAAEDFVGKKNGCMVDPFDEASQVAAFTKIMRMEDQPLLEAQEESLRLARDVDLETFVKGVSKFL